MSFFEQRLDERISFGARGGPMWRTQRVVTLSGRRWVDRQWSYPLHRYNVAHAIKTNADFEAIRAFFYTVSGSYDGFRFKDWADFTATRTNSRLVVAAGSPTEWQLNRVYAVGSREFLRPIAKPCATPSPVVYRTRGGSTTVASATVDTTTGLATIVGHVLGDTYTWAGEFDVPVAFADDAMQAEIVDHGPEDYLIRWDSIVVEELRAEDAAA